ncbi:hypothetical protein CC86DRAFT_65890 [Ophiobolus disseminans]|uniref:Uncharacterized protein n=1 Tax=Ophiobolus disseminans TaxID=1469910 RepID=A0A6A6ZQC7_9PLEO|nr:hypothetical protein CC86DRAFT_65890 [Ophiobolus disseminans]
MGMPLAPQGVTQHLIVQNLHVGVVGGMSRSIRVLHNLELCVVSIHPGLVVNLVKRSALTNLSRLVLDRLTCPTHNWGRYHYPLLSKAIVEYLPKLLVLECVHMQTLPAEPKQSFGSFKSLAQLRTLRLDFRVLVEFRREVMFFDDRDFNNLPKDHEDGLCELIASPVPSAKLGTLSVELGMPRRPDVIRTMK